MSDEVAPAFMWLNRQRTIASAELNLPLATLLVQRARPDVMAAVRHQSVLPALREVSFVMVSDSRIAGLHGDFLGDPTPTDVITFLHGEIVVSAETARREALARGIDPGEELARYAIHGLLHLAGWTDAGGVDAAEMNLMQENILRRAARGLC